MVVVFGSSVILLWQPMGISYVEWEMAKERVMSKTCGSRKYC